MASFCVVIMAVSPSSSATISVLDVAVPADIGSTKPCSSKVRTFVRRATNGRTPRSASAV